jgi:hypothetical protein
MEVCELCGNKKKNLGSHVRAKHDMSMDEYRLVAAENMDVTDEINGDQIEDAKIEDNQIADGFSSDSLEAAGISVTQEERISGILDVEKRFTEDMKVGELLKLKGISLQELGSIITQYISGSAPHPSQTTAKNEQLGVAEAKKLLGEANPGVTNLHIAEALTKTFGYTVQKVTKNPKTWWLQKPLT